MRVCTSCGRRISPGSWCDLPLVGEIDNGRERGESLELRNCSCGSTLSKPIGEHAPPSTAPTPAVRPKEVVLIVGCECTRAKGGAASAGCPKCAGQRYIKATFANHAEMEAYAAALGVR